MEFKRFVIEEDMPGVGYGTGGIGLADFDGDGDLDVVVSRRSTKTAYWYQRITDDKWARHIMGSTNFLDDCLGAVAMDVNGNGYPDMVFSYCWFENPGCLDTHPDTPWIIHEYNGHGHDIVAADINNDGVLDIVTYDGITLAWYDCGDNLKEHIICRDRNDHGGVAPSGIGDITKNGYNDILLVDKWYENPGKNGGEWKTHSWPYIGVENASYGKSMRSYLVDLNGDGELDIVYSTCDTGWSHVYIVKNLGKGLNWEIAQLKDPPGNKETGSFHSLIVADFNNDGVLEIFAGEQEDKDDYMVADGLTAMKPQNLKERGVMWILENAEYIPHIINEGFPGWHDAIAGDVNGNGKLDIVSKVWNTSGGVYHIDYWQNV